MGKHSLVKQSKQTFNKTLAIALAAGVSFGGVQVVGPEMGLNTVAEASAAELDPSVVTKTELVSEKSGQNVLGTTVEATDEAYNAFFDEHGEDYKLKLDLKIPDNAQPGDTLKVYAHNTPGFGVSGYIPAVSSDGKTVVNANVEGGSITFTVSDQVSDSINRTASYEIPLKKVKRPTPEIETKKKEEDNTPGSTNFYFTSARDKKLTFNFVHKYVAPKTKPDAYSQTVDEPITFGFSSVNIDTGSTQTGSTARVGHADVRRVEENDPTSALDDVLKLDPGATTPRDVTIRYTLDDPNGRVFVTEDASSQNVYKFSPTGSKIFNDRGDAKFYSEVKDKSYKVTNKQVNKQTLEVTIHNVEPGYAVNLYDHVKAESPYSPGKTVKFTGEFINGVGEPHTSYNDHYTERRFTTYTHPTFEGYGSAEDIKRNASMSAKVNGNDADNVNSAEQVKNGKAKFSVDLKNEGNIGAASATVKYPKGVTGPKGETEKFFDFGKEGFPVGSTKNLDLGELNVSEGTNENKFTVEMTGYKTMSDPAWTATGPTDIYIDGTPTVNPDGTVTLHRNDGEDITFKVPTGSKVEVNDNGDLVITNPGEEPETVKLKHTKIDEKGESGKPGHKIIITDEDGNTHEFDGFDTYVESIEKQKNGDYLVKRNDGETWTIKLSDIKKDIADLKGKDKEQDKRLDDLENRANGIDEELKNLGDRITKNEGAIEDHRKSINDLNQEVGNINNELGDIKDELARLDGQDIKEVRDNGDGTYTLIRNNDEEVPGKIGDGQDIKELIPNEDGTMTVVHKDGSESKVDLKQVTITEENAGTPEHTVTITSPNGDTVTFNVFDKYVTNVVKNENGDYDIFRSDIDGGETVWKTIVLSDLRDKIAALEDRADKLEKKDQALQDEIDELKDRMGKAEDNIKALQDKTEGLEDDVRKINAHLSTLDLRVSAIDAKLAVLEGRVDDLEDTNKKWAECYSGIGMAAIPLAIAAPLAGLANMDIPFLNQANTDIQKRLGVYNPDLAKAWGQYGGVMKAVAGLVGLMGAIGAITYAGNQCNPYNQTDDVKDTKLGKLSSKFESVKSDSSSRKEDA